MTRATATLAAASAATVSGAVFVTVGDGAATLITRETTPRTTRRTLGRGRCTLGRTGRRTREGLVPDGDVFSWNLSVLQY